MIGQTAPTDPVEQFLEPIKDLQRRVADLERNAGRAAGWTTGVTGTVKFGGSTTNVTSSRRHRVVGGDTCEVEFGWATTGAVTAGQLTLDLPFTAAQVDTNVNAFVIRGTAGAVDQGVAHWPDGQVLIDNGGVSQATIDSTGASASLGWSNTVPHTWKSGDYGNAIVRYRIAT